MIIMYRTVSPSVLVMSVQTMGSSETHRTYDRVMPARPDSLADLLARVHVVALPMRVRFRGITTREVALIDGPTGWGEFGAFPEYDDGEAAAWLASAIDGAYGSPPPLLRQRIPINATVPAVAADEVPAVLERFPGARTAKVKVAEPGQQLADDVARVNAVRAHIPTVRVDANGGWSVEQAVDAARALTADGAKDKVVAFQKAIDETAQDMEDEKPEDDKKAFQELVEKLNQKLEEIDEAGARRSIRGRRGPALARCVATVMAITFVLAAAAKAIPA